MKEYTVVFSLKPAVKLPSALENIILNFESEKDPRKIVISKIEENVTGASIQSGLLFRVFIRAENLKEAVNEAKSFADGIVSFITLVTGIGLDIPLEELAYEITPTVEEREFIQFFHDPLHMTVSRRTLDHQLLTLLIDMTMKLKPDDRERVGRAIQWYRIGSMTPNVFDKFNCFWIGLEALNPILQEKFSVGNDPIKCPKCEYEWVPTPTVSGIRTFIQTNIPEGRELYRRFHNLRVDLVHSRKGLGTLRKEVVDLVPRISEVLFRAICFLLGIAEWDKIPYKGILEKVPLRIELEAVLVGGDPKSLGPEGRDSFLSQNTKS